MESELEALEQQLRSANGVPPAERLIAYLRLVRELHVRDSATVARYGSLLLRNHKGSLAEEELWLVHEQVAIAALDSCALPFAESLARAVARRFPESIRARRLQAMCFEARGEFEVAEKLYREMLTDDPASEVIGKRLVALERSRGNLLSAIDVLKKYVDVFSNDKEAWEELAEMYLEVNLPKQAAFCYEELIMHNPGHSNYLVRYADILYTLGGAANYKTARAYYAKVVEATGGGSLRALYGICACTANIADKVSVQDSRSRAQLELPEVSAQSLLRIYQTSAPDKLPMVTALLAKQGLV
ncbi:MAG: hypothetical protein WDW36_003639 [Sanguina aurantia]